MLEESDGAWEPSELLFDVTETRFLRFPRFPPEGGGPPTINIWAIEGLEDFTPTLVSIEGFSSLFAPLEGPDAVLEATEGLEAVLSDTEGFDSIEAATKGFSLAVEVLDTLAVFIAVVEVELVLILDGLDFCFLLFLKGTTLFCDLK